MLRNKETCRQFTWKYSNFKSDTSLIYTRERGTSALAIFLGDSFHRPSSFPLLFKIFSLYKERIDHHTPPLFLQPFRITCS